MNIKEFLMENYIYIMIVIGLIIITIIGFLADKKGKNANKDILPNNNPNPGNISPDQAAAPMNYQPAANPMNYQPATNEINNQPVNNMPLGNNFGQTQIPPEPSNNLNVLPGSIQGTIVSPNMNVESNQLPVEPTPINVVPQPVEQVNNSVVNTPEPMYQPLSEQKPVIAPVEPINNIQNFNQNQVNNPMNFGPVNNNLATPNMAPNMMGINNPSVIPTPPVGTTPTPIPTPQPVPVNPVPIPSPQAPNIPVQPQPVQTGMSGPTNFVYGAPPQNQNMNGNM